MISRTVQAYAIAALSIVAATIYLLNSNQNTVHVVSDNVGAIGTNKPTVERNTKSLESSSQKKAVWENNPFERIDPSTVKIAPIEFKKPSLEWQPRVINGIVYKFGDGDPKEVTSPDVGHEGPSSAVTPETERSLLAVLGNPILSTIVNRCGKLLAPENEYDSSPITQEFPNSIYETDFSLEQMLYIDPDTGWKK